MSEKYGITAEEKEKVLDNYFKGDFSNVIEVFPSKEKKENYYSRAHCDTI